MSTPIGNNAPSSNTYNVPSKEKDSKAVIQQAAINWLTKNKIPFDKQNPNAVFAAATTAKLWEKASLTFDLTHGYQFRTQNWLQKKLAEWFSPDSLVDERLKSSWGKTGYTIHHMDIFNAMNAFKKPPTVTALKETPTGPQSLPTEPSPPPFSDEDVEKNNEAQIAANRDKQAQSQQEQIQRREKRLAEANLWCGKLYDRGEEIDKQLQDQTTVIGDLEQNLFNAQRNVKEKEAALRILEREKKAILDDMEPVEKEKTEAETNIKTLPRKLEELQAELAQINQKIHRRSQSSKGGNQSAEVEDLKPQKDAIEVQIRESRKIVSESKAKISTVKERFEELQSTLKEKMDKISSLNRGLEESKTELLSTQKALRNARGEHEILKTQQKQYGSGYEQLFKILGGEPNHGRIKEALESIKEQFPDIDAPLPEIKEKEELDERFGVFLDKPEAAEEMPPPPQEELTPPAAQPTPSDAPPTTPPGHQSDYEKQRAKKRRLLSGLSDEA